MNPILINVVTFYGAWFACILGAAHQYWLLGPLVVIAALGVHFYFLSGYSHLQEWLSDTCRDVLQYMVRMSSSKHNL